MGIKKCWYRIYQGAFKLAMNFLDWSEPQLLEGKGSVLRLPEFIKSKGINKVLVVTDKGLMSLNLLDPMFEKLKEAGVEYVVYDGVQPNPTIPNIEAAREMYLKKTVARALSLSAAVLRWTAQRLRAQGLLSRIKPFAK